jgi:hypothetical protein
MRGTTLLLLAAACLSLGCGKAAPPSADDPAGLAAFALELQADPTKAEARLTARGLTQAQFDALMYEVALNPEKARAYRAALGK